MDEQPPKKIKIFKDGEPVLRKKARPVPVSEIKSKKIQSVIKKMEKSIAENEDAVAVAAPQIGENLRITVISKWVLSPSEEHPKTEFENMVFINPEITKMSRTKKDYPEGCLSAPGIYGTVKRAEKVKIEAYDENGKKFSRGASGLLSQTIQHEIDHLDGTLFLDKASDLINT